MVITAICQKNAVLQAIVAAVTRKQNSKSCTQEKISLKLLLSRICLDTVPHCRAELEGYSTALGSREATCVETCGQGCGIVVVADEVAPIRESRCEIGCFQPLFFARTVE